VTRAITFLVICCALTSLVATEAQTQDARLLVSVIAEGFGPLREAQVRIYTPNQRDLGETLIFRTKTNASGRVTILVAPNRLYTIRVSHPAYGGPHEVVVHPPAGDIAVPVRLYGFDPAPEPDLQGTRDESRGALRGLVFGTSGEPLAKLAVRAKSSVGYAEFTAFTREDGSYRIPLPPGRYRIEAGGYQWPSHEFKAAPIFINYARAQSGVVPVERGYATTINLTLVPALVMYNVTVSLIDRSNQPVDDADLTVFGRRAARGSEPMSSFIAITQARDGKPAAMGPLPPGPVTIVGRSVSGLDQLAGVISIDVQEWPQEVTLRLLPTAGIAGRVEFAGRDAPLHGTSGLRLRFELIGWPSPGHFSTGDRSIATDGTFELTGLTGDGCLRMYGLPPGWRVRAISHQERDLTNRPFALTPGDHLSDVMIHVERGNEPPGPTHECAR
jgi:hypothetical protein